jgi:hypothetical protein
VDISEAAVAALRRLGSERSTGALEVFGPARLPDRFRAPLGPDGQAGPAGPRGRIHLVGGAVAYAEALAVPGVDVRLVRAGPVSDAELERIVRSATIDATVSLLGDAEGARWLFRAGPTFGRWAGRLAVEVVLDEAVAGFGLLAEAPVGPDDTIALAAAGSDGVVLGPALMAVLVGVADGRTPRQAAWQSGLSVLEAVGALSDLADQGGCAVVTPGPRPTPAAPPSPPAAPSVAVAVTVTEEPAEAAEAEPAPSRHPDLAPLPCRPRPQTVRPRAGHEPVVALTDTRILNRLIEGLRRA